MNHIFARIRPEHDPVPSIFSDAATYITANTHDFSFASPDAVNDFRDNTDFRNKALASIREHAKLLAGYDADMRARFCGTST